MIDCVYETLDEALGEEEAHNAIAMDIDVLPNIWAAVSRTYTNLPIQHSRH